jgi:hypothetical protein
MQKHKPTPIQKAEAEAEARLRAARDFPGQEFNFHVFDEFGDDGKPKVVPIPKKQEGSPNANGT